MSSNLYWTALSAASLGLASASHCAVMCGPLALAAKLRGGPDVAASYFGGRLVSYVALGALAGGVGGALFHTPWVRWVEAALAWLLAATLLWTGWSAWSSRPESALLVLGRGPRTSERSAWSWGIARLLARLSHDPILLGALTALLPCTALFAALSAAALAGSPLGGALSMFCFASVTGVAVVLFGKLAPLRMRSLRWRRAVGAVLIAGAVLTGFRSLSIADASPGATCPLHGAAR